MLAIAILTVPYWTSGVTKLMNISAALAEARALNLSPAWLIVSATILVQLCGPALLLLGYWPWLAAAALAGFTMTATVIAHPFWTEREPALRLQQRNVFLEHVGLVGGLLLAAMIAQGGAPL